MYKTFEALSTVIQNSQEKYRNIPKIKPYFRAGLSPKTLLVSWSTNNTVQESKLMPETQNSQINPEASSSPS